MDLYWSEKSPHYARLMAESKAVANAHEFILERVAEAEDILDFCCGDGLLASKLPVKPRLAVYDRSESFLSLARARLADRPVDYYRRMEDIPTARFGVVIACFVLMSFRSGEWPDLLREVCRIKRDRGRFITIVTHPCFRDRAFSYFGTSYGDEGSFDYLAEDVCYTVTIHGAEGTPEQRFPNYHHSIANMFSRFAGAGLVAIEVAELPDADSGSRHPGLFPPYLAIVWQRR